MSKKTSEVEEILLSMEDQMVWTRDGIQDKTQAILAWHTKQLTLAQEQARKEVVEEIVEDIKYMRMGYESMGAVEALNDVIDSLLDPKEER